MREEKKEKNANASALARLKWKKYTRAERMEISRKMNEAKNAKYPPKYKNIIEAEERKKKKEEKIIDIFKRI